MRASSIKAIYDRAYESLPLDGIWKEVMGEPEPNGAWLIWGPEKNGKTWFTLMLANYLSKQSKVLYVSAEEGLAKGFVSACKRAGIEPDNKQLKVMEYISIEELKLLLDKRRAPKIVVLDNLTIYSEEMKYGVFRKLLKIYPNTLFIFVAHEESGQPYTSTAKLCKKLAKVIVRVKGLAAHVSGRVPGGNIIIDETQAQISWGTNQ